MGKTSQLLSVGRGNGIMGLNGSGVGVVEKEVLILNLIYGPGMCEKGTTSPEGIIPQQSKNNSSYSSVC